MILIVISETKGAHIPFKQKYRHAPADMKTEFTTKDDVGFWLYSSGSTGSPKGAIHSQYDMVVATEGFGRGVLGLTENDIVFLRRPPLLRLRPRQLLLSALWRRRFRHS